MTVLFLIRSLETGGAERQLVALANGLSQRGHAVHVAVFYGGGGLEENLRRVTLHYLRKRGRWDVPGFLLRLRALIRQVRPDVLHGYLGTANVLVTLLRPFAPPAKTIWGVRAAFMDLRRYGWLPRLHWRIECGLSERADLIILNSESGRNHALSRGMWAKRMHVVPNGIDTNDFRPLPEAREKIRQEWGIPVTAPLVGLPGRLDPMKDHPVFLEAAAQMLLQIPDARFVCVGHGEGKYPAELRAQANALKLADRMLWIGSRTDMPAVYNALDLVCLSSYGEGFPNVLGEAMACGVPCVATDVGDSALILGELGLVVPPKNPEALAKAMLEMLGRSEREGEQLRLRLRTRIEARFSVERMVETTETLLLELIAG
ncbi:MAG: glycosyltransferase [Desulfovibrio sp.]